MNDHYDAERERASRALVPFTGNGSSGKVPVVKSANFFANFQAVTHHCDAQLEEFGELCQKYNQRHYRVDLYREGYSSNGARLLLLRLLEGAEQCTAELKQVLGDKIEDIHNAPYSYLMYRIGKMVKGMPDAKSSAGKGYAQELAERLEVEELSVMAVESVFQQIEDTFKKPSSRADVLPLLGPHKRKWQKRMDALNVKHVESVGSAIIFAAEFKQSVFVEALLEYLNAHGYADLIEEMHDQGGAYAHDIAIHATARGEGLTDLVARLEGDNPDLEAWGRSASHFD